MSSLEHFLHHGPCFRLVQTVHLDGFVECIESCWRGMKATQMSKKYLSNYIYISSMFCSIFHLTSSNLFCVVFYYLTCLLWLEILPVKKWCLISVVGFMLSALSPATRVKQEFLLKKFVLHDFYVLIMPWKNNLVLPFWCSISNQKFFQGVFIICIAMLYIFL